MSNVVTDQQQKAREHKTSGGFTAEKPLAQTEPMPPVPEQHHRTPTHRTSLESCCR